MKGCGDDVRIEETRSLKMTLPAKKGNEMGKRDDVLGPRAKQLQQLCHDHHR